MKLLEDIALEKEILIEIFGKEKPVESQQSKEIPQPSKLQYIKEGRLRKKTRIIPWKNKLTGVTGRCSADVRVNKYRYITILGDDDFFQDKKEVTCRTVGSSGGCNNLSSSVEDKNTVAVGVIYGVPNRRRNIDAEIPHSVNQRIITRFTLVAYPEMSRNCAFIIYYYPHRKLNDLGV